MSKYTTEVRYICEKASGFDESKGFADVDTIIAESLDKIFSFSFPIFDETYKDVLCTKILRHYYTREIGFETVGLWKLKLETLMNEIMPYYNQLYESELIKFNPLYDVDLHTTNAGNKNTDSTTEESRNNLSNISSSRSGGESYNKESSDVEANNKSGNATNEENGKKNNTIVDANNYSETEGNTHYDLYSDTPQGALTGVESQEYLSSARKITDSKTKSGKNDNSEIGNEEYNTDGSTTYGEKSDRTNIGNEKSERSSNENANTAQSDIGTRNSENKINSTESYIVHVVGKQAGASYSKLLKEFRETFLNIDVSIIKDLAPLFMNLW